MEIPSRILLFDGKLAYDEFDILFEFNHGLIASAECIKLLGEIEELKRRTQVNKQQHIAEAKQKIKEALKELEEATGEVVEDIGIDRIQWQSFSEEGYCVVKTINILFKEKSVEGWG